MRLRQLVPIVAMLGVCACAPNYSQGERLGVVVKISQKGMFFKSWEGQALMVVPNNATVQPEVFTFNVAPSAVEDVALHATANKSWSSLCANEVAQEMSTIADSALDRIGAIQ